MAWLDILEPSANLIRVAPQGANFGEVGPPSVGNSRSHAATIDFTLQTRNRSATPMSGLNMKDVDIVRFLVHS